MLRFRGGLGHKLVLRVQVRVFSQADLVPAAYWADERTSVAGAPRFLPGRAIMALIDQATDEVVTTGWTDESGLAVLIVPVWTGERYHLAVTRPEGREVYAVLIDQHDGYHEAVLKGH